MASKKRKALDYGDGIKLAPLSEEDVDVTVLDKFAYCPPCCLIDNIDKRRGVSDEDRMFLEHLDRPEAIAVSKLLNLETNVLGYKSENFNSSRSSLGSFMVKCKEKHQRCIIFVQRGDFYESCGTDAVKLVEILGLTAMGNRPETGVPKTYLQSHLNRLTRLGFSSAVYDQEDDDEDLVSRTKTRTFKQIVSPANPILYNVNSLFNNQIITSPDALPYVFLSQSSMKDKVDVGVIHIESKLVNLASDVTLAYARTVAMMSSAGVICIGTIPNQLLKYVQGSPLFRGRSSGQSSLQLIKQTLNEVYCVNNVAEFTIKSTRNGSALCSVTAQYLGLVPGFSESVNLPASLADGATVRKYLQELCLNPDKEKSLIVARALRAIHLSTAGSLPQSKGVLSPGRLLSFINHTVTVNSKVLTHVFHSFDITQRILKLDSNLHCVFFELSKGETNVTKDTFDAYTKRVVNFIESILILDNAPADYINNMPTFHKGRLFFEKNENFKTQYKREQLKEEIRAVDNCFQILQDSLTSLSTGWENAGCYVYGQLVFRSKQYLPSEDIIEIRPIQSGKGRDQVFYSTVKIETSSQMYIRSCHEADAAGKALCIKIAGILRQNDATTIVLDYAFSFSALTAHILKVSRDGWNLPSSQTNSESTSMSGVFPFWIPEGERIDNYVEFETTKNIVLTGSNAAGKSTLLRSIGAACVLKNAGLCLPCKSFLGPGFANIFMKLGNADNCLKRKSSWVNEISDLTEFIAVAVESETPCLFLLDEIFRGTSTNEGSSLAGAFIEFMDNINHFSIISTHFHEVYDQKLALHKTSFARMEVTTDGSRTYKLSNGKCLDSQAFAVALNCGFPMSIISRAEDLIARRDGANSSEEVCLPRRKDPAVVILKMLREIGINSEVCTLEYNSQPPTKVRCALYFIVRATDELYIGETKDLHRRIADHKQSGKFDIKSRLFFVIMSNKTESSNAESQMINKAAADGLHLMSTVDGKHSITTSW